jgi:hypothetical protein
MKRPYPGFAPNYKIVTETAGYKRTCLVIDILSLERLSSIELAIIEEQLSAQLCKLSTSMPNLERCEVITPDRFDIMLSDGLRVNRN